MRGALMCRESERTRGREREKEDPLFLIEGVLVFGVRIKIAGWERELTLGSRGELTFPGSITLTPEVYRKSTCTMYALFGSVRLQLPIVLSEDFKSSIS